jgi:hypothetical protein
MGGLDGWQTAPLLPASVMQLLYMTFCLPYCSSQSAALLTVADHPVSL